MHVFSRFFYTVLFQAALTLCATQSAGAQGMTKVIAHRGHWTAEGAAQNSIRSFIKADSINCYGSEFDIWMTGDDVPVVNHDASFKGVVMEESPSADVVAVKLDNGERLPRLDSFLQAVTGTSTRLICEVKSHKDKKKEEKLIREAVRMMKEYGLSHRVEYITFSREGLLNLIKYAPSGTPVYYLTGDMTPAELKAAGAAGFDYNIGVVKLHPEWLTEAHELGLKTNVWTVDDEVDMQWCISHGADFITTNRPERLFRLLW